jgi:hypothetical protein
MQPASGPTAYIRSIPTWDMTCIAGEAGEGRDDSGYILDIRAILLWCVFLSSTRPTSVGGTLEGELERRQRSNGVSVIRQDELVPIAFGFLRPTQHLRISILVYTHSIKAHARGIMPQLPHDRG